MGIYDNKKQVNFKLGFSLKKLKYPLLLVIGIILIVLAFFAVQPLFQPQPIIASINPNPLSLAQDSTALLTVDAVNTTGQNASSALIKVIPAAPEMFVVTPLQQRISTLEAGGRRQFVFQVRPFNSANAEAAVPPGDYKIRIVFQVNAQEFSKELVLQIK
ncbi:MAG TPA: hypothetical protein VI977_06175 [archaeon]|nr:hypothetical protein [archaeon]